MTDKELRDEAMTLILAGHETTALVVTYAFMFVGLHPDAERRLSRELAEALGGRAPTLDDLPRLKFTEAVILEAMRLNPPAWALGREPTVDVTIGGHTIAKGTQIWLSPYVVHRDPRWFSEPERFMPERWLDGLAKKVPKYAFFPFGGGPRQCIGNTFAMMEAVLLTATIASRFRVLPLADRPAELAPAVTLRPRDGLPVRIAPPLSGPPVGPAA